MTRLHPVATMHGRLPWFVGVYAGDYLALAGSLVWPADHPRVDLGRALIVGLCLTRRAWWDPRRRVEIATGHQWMVAE